MKENPVVFRATVLSIVLSFFTGQHAALLCKMWCDPTEARTTACDHLDTTGSTRVSSGVICTDTETGFPAFVREDIQRIQSPLAAHHAAANLRLADTLPDASRDFDPLGLSLGQHPPHIPLRI
ncbi:MAG: hypothetical protein WBC51_19790 [Vicinamibacterales bacterium]